MAHFKILLIFCATLGSLTESTSLPSFLKPCQKSQPKEALAVCLLEQARIALPYFTNGLPELGIEKMDPMEVGDFTAQTGSFKIKEKNGLLKGLSKMEIRQLKWDFEKNTGVMKMFGNLTMLSDYESDGRVLIVPVTGAGKMTVKMYNTEITLRYKIKVVKGDDGRDHLATYELKPTQTYGNVKLHLTNLLGGSALGDTINQVLNDNWRELFKEVGPPHTRVISNKVHDIINNLYSKVPLDDMFVM